MQDKLSFEVDFFHVSLELQENRTWTVNVEPSHIPVASMS